MSQRPDLAAIDPYRAPFRWPELLPWLAIVAAWFLFPDRLPLGTQVLIAALFALSLDLALGYAGIATLGHAAYLGLGAYVAGWLGKYGWTEPISGALLAALAAGVLGAAPMIAWAFSQDGLTTDKAPIAARVDAGHEFGALLVLMAAVLLVAGLAVHFAVAQRPPTPRTRRIAGRAALGVLALLPIVALVALARADGGVSGQVSKTWDQLTDPNAKTPANTPDRLTATSSVRARYWKEALDVHATSPWVGVGAGAYGTVRTRFRTDTLAVRHAHGYVVQTLADLGWAGLAASLLAAFAWLAAAARATGVHRRFRRLPFDAERVGMVTLAIVVIVFAAHSAVDWTWFVPANTGVALLCAGWVVGRGPLQHRLEHPDGPTRPPATWPHASRLARFANTVPPLHGLAAGLVLVLALAAAWTAFQPVRAVHASDAAFERLDQGQPDAAADIARIATQRDPLAADPLFELAAIEQARGRSQEAETALAKAVELEPANAETWRRLGELRLTALNDPQGALKAFQAAYYLDPHAPESTSDILQASRAAQGTTTPGTPAP